MHISKKSSYFHEYRSKKTGLTEPVLKKSHMVMPEEGKTSGVKSYTLFKINKPVRRQL